SIFFWSLATVFTGFGTTLLYFILIRGVATGGGEAFYAPAANALIGEAHEKTRSFALAIHQTAVYAGIILSGWLAGYIAQHLGWQASFYAFGGFGVLLALLIHWRVKGYVVPVMKETTNVFSNAKLIFKVRSFWWLTGAFACMVIVNTGYLTWMPTYLYERFELSLSDAGFSSMFYHHIGAFLGVLVGGRLSDKLALKSRLARPLIQMVGLIAGAPFIYFMAISDSLSVTY